MLIVFTLNASAQHSIDNGKASTGLIIGGVGFTLLGITTGPDWEYQGTQQVYKPLWNQKSQTCAIATGVVLTITGLITLATEGKGQKRRRHVRY